MFKIHYKFMDLKIKNYQREFRDYKMKIQILKNKMKK